MRVESTVAPRRYGSKLPLECDGGRLDPRSSVVVVVPSVCSESATAELLLSVGRVLASAQLVEGAVGRRLTEQTAGGHGQKQEEQREVDNRLVGGGRHWVILHGKQYFRHYNGIARGGYHAGSV
jgi:hypothetical protein